MVDRRSVEAGSIFPGQYVERPASSSRPANGLSIHGPINPPMKRLRPALKPSTTTNRASQDASNLRRGYQPYLNTSSPVITQFTRYRENVERSIPRSSFAPRFHISWELSRSETSTGPPWMPFLSEDSCLGQPNVSDQACRVL
ncbi:hypothetical protein K0M31_010431 [Melipona bicolor]|uniref:Uncharacterized protein n=1 Tax=Melipona bicolor TaxID=60889 RepID=A0AA40KIN6_9HYME|nr:hypothetical protein K0M31_010431 [Melipona bicolor]